MPRSKRSRCSGRLIDEISMCRSWTTAGSTAASDRARKSACFWLSPSSATRSPGLRSVWSASTGLVRVKDHPVHERSDRPHAFLLGLSAGLPVPHRFRTVPSNARSDEGEEPARDFADPCGPASQHRTAALDESQASASAFWAAASPLLCARTERRGRRRCGPRIARRAPAVPGRPGTRLRRRTRGLCENQMAASPGRPPHRSLSVHCLNPARRRAFSARRRLQRSWVSFTPPTVSEARRPVVGPEASFAYARGRSARRLPRFSG